MNEGLVQRGKSEQSDEWQTPTWLFQALNAEFGFDFDAAASADNHLCGSWTDNIVRWSGDHPDPVRAFCNPPYSMIHPFVSVALSRRKDFWYFLLPAFSDKMWYRQLWESRRCEFRPFAKRIRFNKPDGTPAGSPFFGSLGVIVRPE